MRDYYQILGLSTSASADEIKRNFRKLVVQYHPDKNPDPHAADRIREINEAYDVLGDPDRKQQYDNRYTGPSYHAPQPTPHRDPAYRRARPNWAPKEDPQFVIMKQSMPYVHLLLKVVIVFCLFLFFDYFLPSQQSEEVITKKTQHHARGRGNSYHSSDVIYTDKGTRFQIDLDNSYSLNEGDQLVVYNSMFMAIPIRISKVGSFSIRVPATIYGNFIFAPIVLSILAGFGLYYRRNVRTVFNIGTMIFFVLLLCLYFIRIS